MTPREDTRPVVGVQPEIALLSHARLFDALTAAFGVRFVACGPGRPACDALVVAGGAPQASAPGTTPVPVLLLAGESAPVGPAEDVLLGATDLLDRRLHGVVLPAARVPPALVLCPEEDVLATGPAGPVWTRRRGAVPLDRVRAVLPSLADDEVLRDGLRGRRAFALTALVAFLRALDPERWSRAPLRAAFVFDDPNLRRITYGHIDYRRLVAHADRHGYHAAMATIPLDAGRASRAAVRMFRERPDRLSLVMHGNNHTRNELMQPQDLGAALALGAQALRRIARMERATGLTVDRVMMPPHGLCARPMVQAMGMLGFEGLGAIHPRPWTEHPDPDELLAGWTPAELLDSCAIFPRFPLTCTTTEIALRAYLDQPLVLYAHHGDVAGGLEPLAEAAERVNRLGDVRWGSLAEIARANGQVTVRNGVATVRPWARRMDLELPADAAALTVAPPPDGVRAGLRGWTQGTLDGPLLDFGDVVPASRSRTELIGVRPTTQVDPGSVPDPRGRPWPVVRRRATEARDRLAPHTVRRLGRPSIGRTS